MGAMLTSLTGKLYYTVTYDDNPGKECKALPKDIRRPIQNEAAVHSQISKLAELCNVRQQGLISEQSQRSSFKKWDTVYSRVDHRLLQQRQAWTLAERNVRPW